MHAREFVPRLRGLEAGVSFDPEVPLSKITLSWAVAVVCAGLPAQAFERLDGFFVATDTCELFQSKNTLENPGNLRTEPNQAYEMLGTNAPDGEYFQVRVPGAPVTEDRWVQGDCGMHVIANANGLTPGQAAEAPRGSSQESLSNVLALSWQSAFCEFRPQTRECGLLNDGELPSAEVRFSVHGLWPQPGEREYCGISEAMIAQDRGRWQDLPSTGASRETLEALAAVMPGVLSALHRHEWVKHGTCYDAQGGADEYFGDTIMLTRKINESEVVRFLAAQMGREVRTSEIRDRFDKAFGSGAGDRVAFVCARDGSRDLLREIRIHLRGEINDSASLSDLLMAAAPVPQGCENAVIDSHGLQ